MKGGYTGTQVLPFQIHAVDISRCSVTMSATEYDYNGKTKTPTITIKSPSGAKLKSGTNYTVTYAAGRKNPGTYTVTIKMKGGYTGTQELSFRINTVDIARCSIKLSTTSYTYSGKVKTPTVTVKSPSGAKLKSGTDYTVTYAEGRKDPGSYTVTIQMKGGYTGDKTLTFQIVPKAASIKKLTAQSGAIAVKINQSLTKTSGYEIQYSTSKSFKNAETVVITDSQVSSTTLAELSNKTKYYVRIRTFTTVDEVNYYSSWSSSKNVKTK